MDNLFDFAWDNHTAPLSEWQLLSGRQNLTFPEARRQRPPRQRQPKTAFWQIQECCRHSVEPLPLPQCVEGWRHLSAIEWPWFPLKSDFVHSRPATARDERKARHTATVTFTLWIEYFLLGEVKIDFLGENREKIT